MQEPASWVITWSSLNVLILGSQEWGVVLWQHVNEEQESWQIAKHTGSREWVRPCQPWRGSVNVINGAVMEGDCQVYRKNAPGFLEMQQHKLLKIFHPWPCFKKHHSEWYWEPLYNTSGAHWNPCVHSRWNTSHPLPTCQPPPVPFTEGSKVPMVTSDPKKWDESRSSFIPRVTNSSSSPKMNVRL